MKKILFATGNASKAKRFSEGLKEKGIEVVSLKDLNIKLDINENGQDAIENAHLKAQAGFQKTHMPTIGMDDSLYIENIPEDKQPGLFVRRINGKILNDEEVLNYYTSLVRQYGKDGKLDAKWIYGLVCINEKGEESSYTWCKDNFYMVDVPSKVINEGYPLSSISKYKRNNKYFNEVGEEDKKLTEVNEDHVVDFISKHV